MAWDLNNFLVDRVVLGVMQSTADGSNMFTINQIKDASIKCDGEEIIKKDSLGTALAKFYGAKNVTLSGSNAIFDLNLTAAQWGGTKKVATSTSKISTPAFEEFKTTTGMTTYVLKNVPTGTAGAEIKTISSLTKDGALKDTYTLGTATATATTFLLDASTKTITLPTGITSDTKFLVVYEYMATEAVSIVNSAKEYPKAGKFIMKVLGRDVCDKTTVIAAYVIMPNASLSLSSEIKFDREGDFPFEIGASQDYCSDDRELVKIVIPNEAA